MNTPHVTEVAEGEEYFTEDRDIVHCKHGTYIGYPGGPDYICGYCEDGISVEQVLEWHRQDFRAIQRRAFWRKMFDYQADQLIARTKEDPSKTWTDLQLQFMGTLVHYAFNITWSPSR